MPATARVLTIICLALVLIAGSATAWATRYSVENVATNGLMFLVVDRWMHTASLCTFKSGGGTSCLPPGELAPCPGPPGPDFLDEVDRRIAEERGIVLSECR